MIHIDRNLLVGGAFLAFALVQAQSASAQDAGVTSLAEPDDETKPSDIIVTGVRGSQARTITDSPVPIDVINASSLQRTGQSGLKDVLNTQVPSFNTPGNTAGLSASVRPYTIRGLPGDFLLVLVNGKRRHTTALFNNLSVVASGSSPVDLDLIPTGAISRIELLRDGAAAQYGSDAISGVMNIILDSAPEGGEFTSTAGQNYKSDGELLQQTLGYGRRLGGDGFIRLNVEAKYSGPANRTEPVPLDRDFYVRLPGGPPDPREATVYRKIRATYGRSTRLLGINTSYNAEFALGGNTRLYSFGTYSYRNIKDAKGAYTPNYNFTLPEIYPDGFQTYRRVWENDWQAAFGIRGELSEWEWDLSTTYGQDRAKLGGENTLNPSLGPTSTKRDFYLGTQINRLWVNNIDLSRAFDIGFATPLIVSGGFEHRWEEFENRAGEPDSYRNGGYIIPTTPTPWHVKFGGQAAPVGLASFAGTTPQDEVKVSRNNVAAYIDLASNITDAWFVALAGRFEHYTDSAGDTVSGKISTRYELGSGFALRGGFNTGFRAPSPAQQGFSTTAVAARIIAGTANVSVLSRLLRPDSEPARLLGSKPLTPEKSINFTGGITFEPNRNVRFSVDAYQIRIDDRIAQTEILQGPVVQSILAGQGFGDLSSARYYINAIDTRTRGIDAVAEYTLRTNLIGTFRLGAAYSYVKTKVLRIIDNPPELAALGPNLILFGRQTQRNYELLSPRSKVVLTANWDIGNISANLRTTRYGRYVESSVVASSDREFGAQWVTDVDVSVALSDKVSLAAGANNIFDVLPDANGIIIDQGSGKYGLNPPFSITGGFYYARIGMKF